MDAKDTFGTCTCPDLTETCAVLSDFRLVHHMAPLRRSEAYSSCRHTCTVRYGIDDWATTFAAADRLPTPAGMAGLVPTDSGSDIVLITNGDDSKAIR